MIAPVSSEINFCNHIYILYMVNCIFMSIQYILFRSIVGWWIHTGYAMFIRIECIYYTKNGSCIYDCAHVSNYLCIDGNFYIDHGVNGNCDLFRSHEKFLGKFERCFMVILFKCKCSAQDAQGRRDWPMIVIRMCGSEISYGFWHMSVTHGRKLYNYCFKMYWW